MRKNGKPEADRTGLGLYFHHEPAKKFLRSRPVANLGIRIPAAAENHRETASWILTQDLVGYSVFPHMHLLGKEMIVAYISDTAAAR